MIILLRDRILGRKPEILFCVQCIIEACLCEASDRLLRIVDSLQDAGAVKLMDQCSCLRTILRREYEFRLARSIYLKLSILVNVTIRMSRQCDRLLPVLHAGFDPLHHNRGAEYCTV